MKLPIEGDCLPRREPAAFRRLCVETPHPFGRVYLKNQPPSGGCVLKQDIVGIKQCDSFQPPSGGCVLKPLSMTAPRPHRQPAAFRRLCVETGRRGCRLRKRRPAAFRRLCVETSAMRRMPGSRPQPPSGGCVLKLELWLIAFLKMIQPPSGGCVLKPPQSLEPPIYSASRLQAAVC